jgi:hypothetical protein
MIGNHPILSPLLARCFNWKFVNLDILGIPQQWVDTGKEWISLPHFSYGYIPEKHWHISFYHDNNQKMLILKDINNIVGKRLQWRLPGIDSGSGLKVCPWLDLNRATSDIEGWSGNLGRKIRRAIKAGLIAQQGGVELLPLFYRVYETRLHHLGSAALPLFFLKELLKNYPDKSLNADARVYLVLDSSRKVVGGAISLFFADFCENTWFATLPEYQNMYSSYILHAYMIKDAIERGCNIYSFGRSTRDSGTHMFKKQWGTTDIELHWLQYPKPKGIDLKNYPFLLNIWKKVPLPLARRFNPFLSKRFY